jgi:hypothetical protein
MRCSEPIRQLGVVDVTDFNLALNQQDDAIWNSDAHFKVRLAPYRNTRAIYLLFTPGGPSEPTGYFSGWEPLGAAFEPIAAAISAFYPHPGRVLNAQVASLPAGATIAPHVDRGPVLEATHRVHIPLKTNPRVMFDIEGSFYALKQGCVYEIDNMRSHAVWNESDQDRIHLIIDYLSPDSV